MFLLLFVEFFEDEGVPAGESSEMCLLPSVLMLFLITER